MSGHDLEHLNFRLTVIEEKIDHLHSLSHAIIEAIATLAENVGPGAADNAKLNQAAAALRAKSAALAAALARPPIH